MPRKKKIRPVVIEPQPLTEHDLEVYAGLSDFEKKLIDAGHPIKIIDLKTEKTIASFNMHNFKFEPYQIEIIARAIWRDIKRDLSDPEWVKEHADWLEEIGIDVNGL